MSNPRLAPLEPPYEASIVAHFEAIMPAGLPPIGIFRTVAHSPRVLQRLATGSLLDRGPVSRRDREIVILRTCARCRAEYEWGVHVSFFASRVGITPEQVEATVLGAADDAAWSPRDACLLHMVDELHDQATVSDACWSALAAEWTAEQIVELLALAGSYHMVSFLTNGLGVALEDGAARFPVRAADARTD